MTRSTRSSTRRPLAPPPKQTQTRNRKPPSEPSQPTQTQSTNSRKRCRTEVFDSDEAPDDNLSNRTNAAANNTSQQNSNAPRAQSPLNQAPDEEELPTLQNYDTEAVRKQWPPSRCKEKLAEGFRNRASIDGKAEIRALSRKWEHLKMLVALALRCSLRTVNKLL